MIMRYIEHNNIDADDGRHHTIAADAELQIAYMKHLPIGGD
jgi:hypothetical protein